MLSQQEKHYTLNIYRQRCRNEISKYPAGFWNGTLGKERGLFITKDLIENVLKLSREDFKTSLTIEAFNMYNLGAMLRKCFNNAPSILIYTLYPNRFKPWELAMVPENYWNEKTSKEAIKWLIEDKLNLSENDIRLKLDLQLISDNKLMTAIEYFNGSIYAVLDCIYPNRFKFWELKGELKFRLEKAEYRDCYLDSKKYKLYKSKNKYFLEESIKFLELNSSGFSDEEIYTKVLKGEFNSFPSGYWDLEETRIKIVRYLFDELLKWNDEQITNNLNIELLNFYKLGTMIVKYFHSSPVLTIMTAYPNRFKPWFFSLPNNYWNNNTALKAIKWLIEDKLKWDDKQVREQLDKQIFLDNGLEYMLKLVCNNSVRVALNLAYPNKYGL